MALPLVIIKFKGIETPEEIRKYRQTDLYVLRKDAPALEECEHYYADLLGMEVTDDTGVYRGKLTDIIETGANDVYIVRKSDGKEILIPVIPECVLEKNPENLRIVVHLLPEI